MTLHFSEQEPAERRRRTCEAMATDGLDALLMFRQESMFYLTGYDTFGFCFFQCLVLGTDGSLTLLTREGTFDGDILAAMQGAVFKGGGDYAGNEFIVGSGEDALLCRYFSGRRTMEAQDQLTLEWAGAYRHYHAAMMRTLVTGKVPERQRQMFNTCRDALAAVQETLRPGNTFGEAFDAHARVVDAAGMQEHRLNACGYNLGTTFSPIWMDHPMVCRGNPVEFRPNMVIFYHMIIFHSNSGLAMTLGETVRVTEESYERLSRSPWDLVEN